MTNLNRNKWGSYSTELHVNTETMNSINSKLQAPSQWGNEDIRAVNIHCSITWTIEQLWQVQGYTTRSLLGTFTFQELNLCQNAPTIFIHSKEELSTLVRDFWKKMVEVSNEGSGHRTEFEPFFQNRSNTLISMHRTWTFCNKSRTRL